MLSLAHAGAAIASAFIGSLVEAVEALTIVLAVGTVRGWRPALAGTLAGLAFLALLVLAFGPLIARMPIRYMQLAVGVLLLLFGMRWLRKAILRAAGVIALHDEAAAFAEESAALRTAQHPRRGWDAIAVIPACKAGGLEGPRAGSRKGATPPRRLRARMGRSANEMARRRRPRDRRAVRRGCGLCARHPRVGRACRVRPARAAPRRDVARGDLPRRLPGAPRRERPARGAQARRLARAHCARLQSKPTISTQFEPFPVGTFCSSLSAPLA